MRLSSHKLASERRIRLPDGFSHPTQEVELLCLMLAEQE